ncbi:MAG TPA: hypothetical protein VFX92_00055 [Candidatus Krumholzibacteria bacterium]|nr:hypothetical protein [Candidatus Krumholzibacteria bacterium]
MKTRFSLVVAALGVLTLLGAPFAPARAQEAPKKGEVKPMEPVAPQKEAPLQKPGTIGETDTIEHAEMAVLVDASVTRATTLTKTAQGLSMSFGKLAALHEGADKSEILMMQRMSDAMGSMASEAGVSLQQYKRMLNEETAAESGAMRNEVTRFKAVLDGILDQVDRGLQSLTKLESQLGQG